MEWWRTLRARTRPSVRVAVAHIGVPVSSRVDRIRVLGEPVDYFHDLHSEYKHRSADMGIDGRAFQSAIGCGYVYQ